MTKNSKEQQSKPSTALHMQVEQRIKRKISPLEVNLDDYADLATSLPDSLSLVHVQSAHGVDAYHTHEVRHAAAGGFEHAYRTVQRLDLATRLCITAQYEPADLVGRTFLVEA